MSEIWYTARQPFGPAQGDRWQGYLRWRELSGVEDLVTLDTSLCPEIVEELSRMDWDHNVQEDYVTFWFRNLDYLLHRTEEAPDRQVLAGWREPPAGLDDGAVAATLADPRFRFQGYELLDVHGDISALSNCTGFDDAYRTAELNAVGLLDSLDRARQVQAALKSHYAGHGHEDTHIWAVWNMEAGGPAGATQEATA